MQMGQPLNKMQSRPTSILALFLLGLVRLASPALFALDLRFDHETSERFSLIIGNSRLTNDSEVGGAALAVDTLAAKAEWSRSFATAAGLFQPGKEYLITFDIKVTRLESNAYILFLVRPLGAEGSKLDVLNYIAQNVVGDVKHVKVRCRIQPDQTNQALQVYTHFQAQAHIGNLVIKEGPMTKPWSRASFAGTDVPIYETPVANIIHLNCGEESEVLTLDLRTTAMKVVVRPLRYGITPTLRGTRLTFKLPKGPCTLSAEVDDNIEQPLFIFSKPAELYRPKPGTENLIFFAAGKVHRPGTITLTNGQTLFIEDGAVVMGNIVAKNASNICITGGGILDGAEKSNDSMVQINGCRGVSIHGITILNSPWWTMPLLNSHDIDIDGVKVVSGRNNDDGLDICGSSNVSVRNSFYRTKDDCISLKSVGPWINGLGNVEDILVENCVLWNGIWGNGVEIGYELRADTVRNIAFKNLDFIHVEGNGGERNAVMSIHLGDRAIVSNVLYENIRVEDAEKHLIHLNIAKMQYSKDAERGHIRIPS